MYEKIALGLYTIISAIGIWFAVRSLPYFIDMRKRLDATISLSIITLLAVVEPLFIAYVIGVCVFKYIIAPLLLYSLVIAVKEFRY